jgi:hypothetical protein
MRPTPLTVICIIGLCLGVFGAFTVLASCGGLIMQPYVEEFSFRLQESIGAPPQAQQQMDAQRAMQHDIMAVQHRWRPWLIGGFLLQATTVTLLVVACIKGLGLKPGAHRWLLAAMFLGIFQALTQVTLNWAMQREMMGIMTRHMAQMMQSTPGAPMPPGMPQMMSGMMSFSTTLSILFIAVWGLAKIGYFAGSAWYVMTADVRRLFDRDDPPLAAPIEIPPV